MKKTIDLSIIIPTLNEEHYIGKLLDSIAIQTVKPKEVIVIDAQSPDGTIKEIKKRQKNISKLYYFQIPKYTVARQRNLGVTKTNAENILFLDADMILFQKDSLEVLYKEALEKKADFAIPTIKPADSTKMVDYFLYILHNGIPKTFKPFKALATTQCLFVTRKIFLQNSGFDEEIKVGEDFEFVSRMRKSGGQFVILKDPVIYNSVRRLEKDGRIRFLALLLMSLIFILIIGYKKNPIQQKYDFGNHPKMG